jgi:hypothetical protein
MHGHSQTCKKDGRLGNHYDCRMGYDLPLIVFTRCITDGCFVVRRDEGCGMLPAFIPALQLACPSNHVMQYTCEVTRWLRTYRLYQDAQKLSDKPVSYAIDL